MIAEKISRKNVRFSYPLVLTVKHLEDILSVSDRTARYWIKDNLKKGLKAIQVGREWRIEREHLFDFLVGKVKR